MIISEHISGGIRIRVEGRLDTGTAPEFRKVLNSLPDDTEVLTVDLARSGQRFHGTGFIPLRNGCQKGIPCRAGRAQFGELHHVFLCY